MDTNKLVDVEFNFVQVKINQMKNKKKQKKINKNKFYCFICFKN